MNGVLEKTYEAHCERCEQGALGLGNTRNAAHLELKQRGWKLINRRWHCDECKVTALKEGE